MPQSWLIWGGLPSIVKLLGVISVCAFILGLMVNLLTLAPRVAVEPPSQRSEVASWRFVIRNEGLLPLYDVTIGCGSSLDDIRRYSQFQAPIERLDPGSAIAIDCALEGDSVSVFAHYRLWWIPWQPWYQVKHRDFMINGDGRGLDLM